MLHPKKSLLVFICFYISLSSIHSQDLEQIGGPLMTLKGNVTVGSSFYNAWNRENSRSPFSYFITANPTFSIYGFDIPVSLTYRDQQGSISNPFNRISFNPSYKWISLNLGKFTKSLSTYSLSGQVVKGVAVDLNPGKFRLSVVRGSIVNSFIQLDTILNELAPLPSYKRNTIGGRIGVGSNRNFIDLIVFKAKDDFNSIDQSGNNLELNRPQENIVIGTAFGISPAKWLSFKADLNASAHTANQESQDYLISNDIDDLRDDFGSVLTLNHSTKLQFAVESKLNFKFKRFGFGAEYRRVDPLYKSLGAFYFQEDFENFLFKTNFSLLQGKVRFNGRGGIQRNNLNNLRKYRDTRRIINTNLTIMPSRNFTIAARYSNFQTDRTPGLVAVNDSIRLATTTGGIGITPRYSFGTKEKRSTIVLGYNRQNLTDLLAEEDSGKDIVNDIVNLSYSINLKPKETRVSLSLVGNRNQVRDIERNRLGINLAYSKKVADNKLQLNVGVGGFQNYRDGFSEGFSVSGRVGARYKLEKSTSISTMINFVNRSGTSGYQEIRGNINATYRFPDVSTSKINKKNAPTSK